jgi:hypothetical protein
VGLNIIFELWVLEIWRCGKIMNEMLEADLDKEKNCEVLEDWRWI